MADRSSLPALVLATAMVAIAGTAFLLDIWNTAGGTSAVLLLAGVVAVALLAWLIAWLRARRAARTGFRITNARAGQTADGVCDRCGYNLSGSPLWGPGDGVKTMRCKCPECGHENQPRASLSPEHAAENTPTPPPDRSGRFNRFDDGAINRFDSDFDSY